MRNKHRGSTITFGIENEADVAATDIDTEQLGLIKFRLITPLGKASGVLPMSGRHNLMNALAASASGDLFSNRTRADCCGSRTATPPAMRGETLDFAAGFTVVDDSYNSNPRFLVSMVKTIAEAGETRKRRIVIAGEMLELGSDSARLHREAGREIARAGIDLLWGIRGQAAELLAGATAAGLSATRFFETANDAAVAIVNEVKKGDLILVKGSRGVATDLVVNAIREHFPLGKIIRTGDDTRV